MVSDPPSLSIDASHVRRQFDRRAPLDGAQFLYGEVAQRLLQRLSLIRAIPAAILDAGCGAGHALEPLRARYPKAAYTGLDASPELLDVARQRHAGQPSFWQKLRNQPTLPAAFQQGDLADTGLPPSSVDLVWSNMALHWHPLPHRVLAEWRRLLRSGGLAMFSSLGPGSLRELRHAAATAGLRTATLPLVDMHDFGDLLLEHGYADPVMDQEILTLTYRQPETLLQDLRLLGGNPNPERRDGLKGRRWREALLAALEAQRDEDGTIHLSMEIAYGHAWRADSYRTSGGETRISLDAIRRRPR